ncbi:sugar ABC transporter ATP-binding protein [Muricomes intestini]|uniref:sugar ABC transporter ATP-binding protein n=1 Tax=Muricomes intestini TaxID=1796634 RepID=UPI002FD991AC
MGRTILTAKHITKLFPGMKALDDVDFDLREGEVHILVGENGAGKSTLAKVILGAYKAEEGEITFDGKAVKFNGTKEALERGIVAVYQEFTLVPHISVAQNIFLNREYRTKMGLLDHKEMEKEAQELMKSLNCEYIDVKCHVKDLSVAEQQMVEIAKALSFKPRIMVFDEPTATLSEREVDSLFDQIHRLKKEGIGIIYVSHRMQEFPLIGDRITILRDGVKIKTVGIDECSNEELVNMMVGRDVSRVYVRTPNEHSETALSTEGLCDYKGKVKDVSICVRRGEIVGIAGLVGAGRTETAELLYGIESIKSGKVFVKGKNVLPRTPRNATKLGIGLVSEDRKRQGLALDESIALNIVAVSLKKMFPRFFLSNKRIKETALDYKKQLRIATTSVNKACKYLSGGNQQKVVLAKWLSFNPDILIFDEPTRGIDVAAKMEIYGLMDRLAAEGKAIIMISSELPEVIGMSDRIYIMHEGRIVDEIERGTGDFNSETIGARMMLGAGGTVDADE